MSQPEATAARRRCVSLVIAVYRNERALTQTYTRIKSVFEATLAAYDYEMVFVDDGSDDGSLAELLSLRAQDPRVKVLSFTRNFGQMAAMLAGFRAVKGDAAINISADLQDPPELIAEMVKQWESGIELSICYRTDRQDGLGAKLMSRIAYGLIRMSIPKIPAGGFDYVLLDRKVVDAFNGMDVRNRFFQGDILWYGYKAGFIPYVRLKRTIGRSQYRFGKRLKNFLDAILDASYLPIRVSSVLGIATLFLGFLYALTIVYSWAVNATPFTGWAPIMITILVVGGLNMFMLGIVGEYVWRIYDEVRKRPNYVIRERYE